LLDNMATPGLCGVDFGVGHRIVLQGVMDVFLDLLISMQPSSCHYMSLCCFAMVMVGGELKLHM
jgi:hypothetical protein